MRYAFPGYPESMNGGAYPFPNPAVGAMGVPHSTTPLDSAHPPVSHSTPHSTPHSTLPESGNHLSKPESSDVH